MSARVPNIDFLAAAAPPRWVLQRESGFRARLGRTVKASRTMHHFTQRELAEKAGITEKYLSRVELGLATPSVLVALRLAAVLGLDLRQLALPVRNATPTLSSIGRLLRERSEDELDRARRILTELFR